MLSVGCSGKEQQASETTPDNRTLVASNDDNGGNQKRVTMINTANGLIRADTSSAPRAVTFDLKRELVAGNSRYTRMPDHLGGEYNPHENAGPLADQMAADLFKIEGVTDVWFGGLGDEDPYIVEITISPGFTWSDLLQPVAEVVAKDAAHPPANADTWIKGRRLDIDRPMDKLGSSHATRTHFELNTKTGVGS